MQATANHLPEELESDRLIIRVSRPGDGAALNEAILESLPELKPWLPWVSPPPTAEKSEIDCRRAYARFLLNEDLLLFFFLKDSGTLVGASGLHKANWELRQFEVGYWGRTAYTGTGLITEGVRTLSDYALNILRAQRVFLTADEQNVKSWRLAERAGFQLEGTLRKDSADLQGVLRNTRVYSRVARD